MKINAISQGNLGIVLLYPLNQGVSILFSGLEAANLGVARPRGRR